nr:hypothetical protein [Halomonas sp.]
MADKVAEADTWLAGGFASSQNGITSPETVDGQTFRAAGPAFEQMLEGAGASIASMPSSEIYTALQTGVLDARCTKSTTGTTCGGAWMIATDAASPSFTQRSATSR